MHRTTRITRRCELVCSGVSRISAKTRSPPERRARALSVGRRLSEGKIAGRLPRLQKTPAFGGSGLQLSVRPVGLRTPIGTGSAGTQLSRRHFSPDIHNREFFRSLYTPHLSARRHGSRWCLRHPPHPFSPELFWPGKSSHGCRHALRGGCRPFLAGSRSAWPQIPAPRIRPMRR